MSDTKDDSKLRAADLFRVAALVAKEADLVGRAGKLAADHNDTGIAAQFATAAAELLDLHRRVEIAAIIAAKDATEPAKSDNCAVNCRSWLVVVGEYYPGFVDAVNAVDAAETYRRSRRLSMADGAAAVYPINRSLWQEVM